MGTTPAPKLPLTYRLGAAMGNLYFRAIAASTGCSRRILLLPMRWLAHSWEDQHPQMASSLLDTANQLQMLGLPGVKPTQGTCESSTSSGGDHS